MPRTPAATTGLSPPCSAWLQAGARAGGRGGARRRVPERRRPRLPQVGGARSPAPGGSATGDPGFLHGRRRERPVRDPAERLAFPWPGARGPPHARTTGAVRGAAGQPRPPSGAVKPRGRAAGCMRRGTYEPARAHAGGGRAPAPTGTRACDSPAPGPTTPPSSSPPSPPLPQPLTRASLEVLPQEVAAGEMLEAKVLGDPLAYGAFTRAWRPEDDRAQEFGSHGFGGEGMAWTAARALGPTAPASVPSARGDLPATPIGRRRGFLRRPRPSAPPSATSSPRATPVQGCWGPRPASSALWGQRSVRPTRVLF